MLFYDIHTIVLLRDILDLVRRWQKRSKDIIGLSVEATLKHSVNNVTYVILAMVQNGGRKLHSKYVKLRHPWNELP